MDTFLVLIASSLVAHKYVQQRKKNSASGASSPSSASAAANQEGEVNSPETDEGTNSSETYVPETSEFIVGASAPGAPGAPGASGAPGAPGAPARLGVNTPGVLETHHQRGNPQPEEDQKGFQEQFYPQDTRATGFSVTQKPWMIAVQNADKPAKTEKEAAFPSRSDRDDVHKKDIPSKLRELENLHTQRTIPRSREKHFESPVEGIATQNEGGGGLRGQRQLQRYHKFLLNDEPRLEMTGGIKGNFTGAGKSSAKSHLDNTRDELVIDHAGAPVAASFKVGIPDAAFELEGSNAEAWLIDKHTIPAGSKAPVQQSSEVLPSFKVAHDDTVDAYKVSENANLSRASRPKPANVNEDSLTNRDASINTQTILGAPGRGSFKPMDTNANFKPKTKDEALALGASKVDFMSSSKASGPGALVVKQDHQHTDDKLAEEDTAGRVRGASLRTNNDMGLNDREVTLNDSKANINNREFTSHNLAAPQNTSLPRHLRIAPTSSVTATTDMTLKNDDDLGVEVVQNSLSRGKVKVVSGLGTIGQQGESTPEERRMKLTTLSDRMASGDALRLLSNPYSRPGNRSNRSLAAGV